MMNEFTWRKTPRDIINNPRMQFLMHSLPPHERQAVALVYLSAYMSADNDGAVSIMPDVCAYECALKSPATVESLVQCLCDKGFFVPMEDGRYLITDFETAERQQKSESMEARRARVESKTSSDCDKKSKSVAKNTEKGADCDKNTKNVANREEKRGEEKDETREEDMRPEEKSNSPKASQSGEPSSSNSPKASQSNEPSLSQKVNSSREETEGDGDPPKNLLSKLTENGVSFNDSPGSIQAVGVFYPYFSARSGEKKLMEQREITGLALLVLRTSLLSEPRLPEKLIARELCGAFTNFARTWRGEDGSRLECLPTAMLQEEVWPDVVGAVFKKLSPGEGHRQYWLNEIGNAGKIGEG